MSIDTLEAISICGFGFSFYFGLIALGQKRYIAVEVWCVVGTLSMLPFILSGGRGA